MDPSIKEFKKILRKNSLYITDQRIQIFTLLLSEKKPISLSQLANSLKGKLDLVTVYRNIDTLEELGIVKKIYSGWKFRIELSERFRPHHHHLTCNSCGAVAPLDLGSKIESEIKELGEKQGFKITNHEVELYGLCQKCRSSGDTIKI